MTKKAETLPQLIKLEDFNVSQLPELQNKKADILAIIEANPIVDIVDNATYDIMKKSRTAVKTLRTGLENEKKEVVAKIKDKVLNTVINAYDVEISAVKDEEKLRQDKVTVWEDAVEAKKEAARMAEEKRVSDIKKSITDFGNLWKDTISLMDFESISKTEISFTDSLENTDRTIFSEFALLFDKEVSLLKEILANKVKSLTEAEENRLEKERLDKLSADLGRINAIRSSIGIWHSLWVSEINKLTFENIEATLSKFELEPALKCQELQKEFGDKRAELQELLDDKISKLKTEESNRLEREQFLREKAEFELKKRTNERIKQLTDLGISDEVIEKGMGGNDRWATLKNSAETEDDSIWEETLLWVTTMIESRNKKSEPSPAALHGIEKEEECLATITTLSPNKSGTGFVPIITDAIDAEDISHNPNYAALLEPIGEDVQDVDFEETEEVDSKPVFVDDFYSIYQKYIQETFADAETPASQFVVWLDMFYQVPEPKQE